MVICILYVDTNGNSHVYDIIMTSLLYPSVVRDAFHPTVILHMRIFYE